ncbi:signal peptidase I [Paenibacillus mesophilus]|uniref:signal peptidase I n=1 Tax=Paenibacillus mesophilus TaxID=2582849 RepID=UPI00110DE704|nr:signal peptidase I [Paenibacillus mesophilus]TMV52010.1 signal peptidase I [Paenibacillus mesophilus]
MNENERKDSETGLADGTRPDVRSGAYDAREQSALAEQLQPDNRNELTSASGTAVKAKNEVWEWTKALLIAFALAFLIRYFLFGSYIVDGPSMKPNFHTGERLIVNKILYDMRTPQRGEVVVFHATPDKDFIKRVIALPGETVKVQGDEVYINGQLLDEPYLKEVVEQAKQSGKSYNDLNWPESKVPEGAVFVMGDNRSDSTDSRMIGPVTFDKIVGRAEIVFWPIVDMQWIH